MTILEAFISIRKNKQRAALEHLGVGEPTRKLLVSSIVELAERTETIAQEGETSREQISNQMRGLSTQVASLAANFEHLAGALRPRITRTRRTGTPADDGTGPPGGEGGAAGGPTLRLRQKQRCKAGAAAKTAPGRVRGDGVAASTTESARSRRDC